MTELIRQDTEYAMRALVHLAVNGKKKQITAKELAKSRDVPEDFMYKILRKLTRAGLTTCHMGYHGGFKLARSPGEITFLQVVSAVQGPVIVRKCCLDPEACPRRPVCGVSPKLAALQDILVRSLDSIRLADVLKQEANI
jgi:Rrf2 family iron-sulfur cluster assembly transcriptional regulator